MMPRFTERELTQLSFLMAWLVKSPGSASRLPELAPELSQQSGGAVDRIVKELQERIAKTATSGTKPIETLKHVAASLLEEHDYEKQTAGRLLAKALEGSGRKLAGAA